MTCLAGVEEVAFITHDALSGKLLTARHGDADRGEVIVAVGGGETDVCVLRTVLTAWITTRGHQAGQEAFDGRGGEDREVAHSIDPAARAVGIDIRAVRRVLAEAEPVAGSAPRGVEHAIAAALAVCVGAEEGVPRRVFAILTWTGGVVLERQTARIPIDPLVAGEESASLAHGTPCSGHEIAGAALPRLLVAALAQRTTRRTCSAAAIVAAGPPFTGGYAAEPQLLVALAITAAGGAGAAAAIGSAFTARTLERAAGANFRDADLPLFTARVACSAARIWPANAACAVRRATDSAEIVTNLPDDAFSAGFAAHGVEAAEPPFTSWNAAVGCDVAVAVTIAVGISIGLGCFAANAFLIDTTTAEVSLRDALIVADGHGALIVHGDFRASCHDYDAAQAEPSFPARRRALHRRLSDPRRWAGREGFLGMTLETFYRFLTILWNFSVFIAGFRSVEGLLARRSEVLMTAGLLACSPRYIKK